MKRAEDTGDHFASHSDIGRGGTRIFLLTSFGLLLVGGLLVATQMTRTGASLPGPTGASAGRKEPQTNRIYEASMNFDLEDVGPFMRRVASKLDGLGASDVAALVSTVSTMEVDAERDWSFEVIHQGRTVSLVIRVFMDDVDAPNMYFFTT